MLCKEFLLSQFPKPRKIFEININGVSSIPLNTHTNKSPEIVGLWKENEVAAFVVFSMQLLIDYFSLRLGKC